MEAKHPKAVRLENKSGKLLSCPLCNQRVDTRREMADHLKTHDSVNELLAESMGEEVFGQGNENGDYVSFRCSECGKEMGSTMEVVRHMREVHGGGHDTRVDNAGQPAEGKIVRQTDPATGSGKTVVVKPDGEEVVFDEEVVTSFVQMPEKTRVDYRQNLCMLGLRGLCTEMGQRLVEETRLFNERKQDRNVVVKKKAFAFFGFDENAQKKEIQDAYKVQARLLHPDKNGGTEDAKAKFQRMKALYEILKAHYANEEEVEATAESGDPADLDCDQQPASQREPKEAYDDEEPVKKPNQPSKSLSYNPGNRNSMETALDSMCNELSHVRSKKAELEAEIIHIEEELGA